MSSKPSDTTLCRYQELECDFGEPCNDTSPVSLCCPTDTSSLKVDTTATYAGGLSPTNGAFYSFREMTEGLAVNSKDSRVVIVKNGGSTVKNGRQGYPDSHVSVYSTAAPETLVRYGIDLNDRRYVTCEAFEHINVSHECREPDLPIRHLVFDPMPSESDLGCPSRMEFTDVQDGWMLADTPPSDLTQGASDCPFIVATRPDGTTTQQVMFATDRTCKKFFAILPLEKSGTAQPVLDTNGQTQ